MGRPCKFAVRSALGEEVEQLVLARSGKISSIAALIVSITDVSALILLVASLTLQTDADMGRVILLTLTVIALTFALIPAGRGAIKTLMHRIIHRHPPSDDEAIEIYLPELKYFVAGEEQDVLVIGNDGSYWGRSFLVLSKRTHCPELTWTDKFRGDSKPTLDSFIESAYSNKIPVQSMVSLSPLPEDEVSTNTLNSLNSVSSRIRRMTEEQRLSYIRDKKGVWHSRITISTRSLARPPARIREIIEEVHSKTLQLKALFNATFPDYVIEKVTGIRELKKTATFLLTHSEGSNLAQDGGGVPCLTGKELTKFMSIPDIATSFHPESFPYKDFQLRPPTESNIIIGASADDSGNPSNPVGFGTTHLKKGIIIFGEDQNQIDLTNKLIVSKLATSSIPYLVFARDEKYRPIMSIIPNAVAIQLGKDFTINPLDPEDTSADDYIQLILTLLENSFPLNDEQSNMLFAILHDIFAERGTPTLMLLKERINDISESGKETLNRTRLLEGIMRTLLPLLTGNVVEALSGSSTVPFKKFLDSALPLVIIEFKGMAEPSAIRFIQGLILAKVYAHYASRKQSPEAYSQRMLLLEEANLIFKQSGLKHIRTSLPPSEAMLKWIQELAEQGVGLHVSTTRPSQVDDSIVAKMGTKITHRISNTEDALAVAKYIQLEQVNVRNRQGTGSSAHRTPLTKYLAEDEILLIRPDLNKPFPAKISYAEVLQLPTPNDSEVKKRMNNILPRGDNTAHASRTMLSIDYQKEERVTAKQILALLDEYPTFGRGSIVQNFDSADQQRVKELLPRLENFRYIVSHNMSIAGGLRKVYRLTEKGIKALEEERRVEEGKLGGPEFDSDRGFGYDTQQSFEAKVEGKGYAGGTARLSPIFVTAVDGLRRAKSHYESGEYNLVLERVNETLRGFLESLARNVGIMMEKTEWKNLDQAVTLLSDSGLMLPPEKENIIWISENVEGAKRGESVIKKEALGALQDALSFLKQTSKIYHVE